ncbi:GAF domain-containing protein [Acaryochloris sp. IP29b_bin.137]|uniref:GAF domain-containing protein n=1 Tax=Acaryochloris sp. IP29b_bin.137 TaxID=2969217 RepID=UPI0026162720|nr:GAF domain-containing protein [Acaryochloris sp. IP29b_bin.137]
MIQRVGQPNPTQLISIQTLIEGLLASEQVEPMVDCALRFLQAELDYPLLWIAAYDADRSELSGLGGSLPHAESSAFTQRYPVLPGDLFDQAVLTGQPIEVMNLQEDSRIGKWQKIAQRYDIQGAILYPIQHRNLCLGVVLLGSIHWGRNPRTEESHVLSIFARTFGAVLHHLQHQAVEPPPTGTSPLLEIVNQISPLTDWEDRLHVILKSTHQVINPTFTGLYWMDYEEDHCVLKSCYQPGQGSRLSRVRPLKAQVQLSEIAPFCQVLSAGQIISVSEREGTVNTKVPLRLMQQTKSRSLLCAPIMGEGRLLGFLSVEGAEPRVWQEQEKNLVQATAQLIGLSVVAPEGERPIQVSSQTHTLMGQFTQLMVESKDWPKTLRKVTEHLCRHLQTQRLVLLQHDERTGEFRVEYQYHSPKHQPLLDVLQPLSDVDARMLERNIGAISITDLEEDLRFLAWRESLMSQGLRSLLVCRTVAGSNTPRTILILGNNRAKTWKPNEIEFVQQFAQTLGTFEQKQRDYLLQQQQLKLQGQVQDALPSLLKIEDPTQLISTGVDLIAEIFSIPLVAGILWVPGQNQGQIVAHHTSLPEFSISEGSPIQLSQDPLLSKLLALQEEPSSLDNLVKVAAAELTPESRRWLNSPGLDKVWGFALRSLNASMPLGAIILGTSPELTLSAFELKQIQTLVQQLAGRYRTLREIHLLHVRWSNSECLHWFKQRSLEHQSEYIQNDLRALQAMLPPEKSGQPPLVRVRATLEEWNSLLKLGDWQLTSEQDSVPLASILRRSMERIESLVQSRQLWTQVHNLTSNTTLTGTNDKLELVLHELLLAACHRSQPGDRIDIWCRLINSKWVELSITDQGQLHPRFIQDFQSVRSRDLLMPNLLDQLPGRNLKACQWVIEGLGGRMELAQLEDGRILSRLTLPLQIKTNQP